MEQNEKKDGPKHVIDIIVSANRLKAYLRVRFFENDSIIEPDEIFDGINKMGITYGIKENDIKEYCSKREYNKELIVAEGISQNNGIDAIIDYKFKLDDAIEFKEKEDGSVDFKNINNIKSIVKDGLLCVLIPPIEGSFGIDVYGSKIAYREGRELKLPGGKNTYMSKDELNLYSSVDGCIYVNGKNIDVDNIYRIKCVDHSTGNVEFIGSVVVQEDVKAGFSVKANDDIVVKGMVEGATLESGRDILISNGMNGRDVGTLIAKGNITSKYLENATIRAGKSVYSDAIINCDVFAEESIILKGSRGAIIGGECIAGEIIQAKNIGTKNNIQTKIKIDLEKYLDMNNKNKDQNTIFKLKQEIEKKENELDELKEKIDYLAPFVKKSSANEKLYKLLILKRVEINKDINLLKASILNQDSNNKKITDHKILCSGIIYANTRIILGWLRYTVRDDLSYSKLYNDGSEIQITPLLPSDLNSEGK